MYLLKVHVFPIYHWQTENHSGDGVDDIPKSILLKHHCARRQKCKGNKHFNFVYLDDKNRLIQIILLIVNEETAPH